MDEPSANKDEAREAMEQVKKVVMHMTCTGLGFVSGATNTDDWRGRAKAYFLDVVHRGSRQERDAAGICLSEIIAIEADKPLEKIDLGLFFNRIPEVMNWTRYQDVRGSWAAGCDKIIQKMNAARIEMLHPASSPEKNPLTKLGLA
ncbi:Uncharacterised protein [uncultured archaeon]|nr:Uncharacterised protein [uncultured archaeon]